MKRLYPLCALLCATLPAFAFVDSNNNGLSDLWERTYNNGQLFGLSFDLQADADGDGWTNAQEAAAGTNPTDPNPPEGIVRPQLTNIPAVWSEPDENGDSVIVTPASMFMEWPTIPSKQYTLLYSPDLIDWLAVPNEMFIGSGSIWGYGIELTDDKLFWRVKIEDVDTDGDGLTNAEEYMLGTNPNMADSDEDGMPDAWEVKWGLNPIDPADAAADADGDHVSNLREYELGTVPTGIYRIEVLPIGGFPYFYSAADDGSVAVQASLEPNSSLALVTAPEANGDRELVDPAPAGNWHDLETIMADLVEGGTLEENDTLDPSGLNSSDGTFRVYQSSTDLLILQEPGVFVGTLASAVSWQAINNHGVATATAERLVAAANGIPEHYEGDILISDGVTTTATPMPADWFPASALPWVQAFSDDGKVLVYRPMATPARPETYLLDVATGAYTFVRKPGLGGESIVCLSSRNGRMLGSGPTPFQITMDGTPIRLEGLQIKSSPTSELVSLASLYPNTFVPHHISSDGRITLTTTDSGNQIAILQLVPYNDTANTGMSNDWVASEIAALVALDPTRWGYLATAGTLDPDTCYWDDRWTAIQSYRLILSSFSRQLSRFADADGDGVVDADDADPFDPVVDWKKSADPNFAVIELPVTGLVSLRIDDLSENGTVLFSRILNGSCDERVLVDSHQGVHSFPRIAQALDEFGSICPTLIGDLMFGCRLVPNSDSSGLVSERCTWNPLDDSYTAFDWWYYEDSIIDARSGYWLNSWLNPVTNEIGEGLYTRQGRLSDSSFMYRSDNSRIDKNGNIRSSGGYWRCEHAANSTISYGNINNVAEDTGGFSATLIQKSATPQGGEVQQTWNLVPGGTCLHVSKNTASFVQAGLHFGTSRHPLAAMSQGWVATPSEIWLNGTWHSLTALLGEIVPIQATLLDMRDTGLSVANIQYSSGGEHKLVLLVPVEMEIKHTEKERDAAGNELTTIINPGRNMLLRDEIADLRIKVPTINGTDWDMKIDIETADMKTSTLGNRGVVQMYDFGKVENGTVTPLTTNSDGSRKVGPYDIMLPKANDGETTFKFVVSKEGTFRLRITSSDNKINVTSQEFTVTKRIRKYGIPYVSFPNHDPNRYDGQFKSAADLWGQYYQHPLDEVDRLKTMSVMESNVGAAPSRENDILSIGDPRDPGLKTIRGTAGFHQYDPDLQNQNACDTNYKWLNYPNAGVTSTFDAIKWGTLWLYQCAWTRVDNPEWQWEKRNRDPYTVLAEDEEPEKVLGPWKSWDTATDDYNGKPPNEGDPLYMTKFDHAFCQGLHYYNGNKTPIWPILTNKSARLNPQP